MRVRLYIIFASLVSTSCTTLSADELPVGASKTYIGVVRIQSAPAEQATRHASITTLGAWANDDTIGLGFLDSQIISVSPHCQITFIIENRQQLENSLDLISSSLGDQTEGICVTGKN